MQTIARVLTQHGFGHLVDSLHLERYVPLPKRWQQAVMPSLEGEPEASIGRRIARVCEELGPTFVKLGQLLSSRPDLVSADIIAELVKLQDRVPPFPTDQARRIIETDLGMPLSQCFAGFGDEPFACGSIAQVYRATTVAADERPSCRVVVKVKRPGIEDTIRLDMTILRWIGDVAERLVPELAVYHPKMIVDEFEQTMMRELDFVNEAATIARFAESIGEDPDFRVPTVFWEFTGPSVLTLEEMHGVSIQTLLTRPDPAIDRKQLADRLARGFVRQFFETGLFHADPHPGNLLVEPPAAIRLIDFGLTGRIDEEMLGHLVMALMGAVNREPEIVVEVLADMDALGEQTDRVQLRRDFLELIEKYYGLPLHRFDMQTLFHEITALIRRNDVTVPREFVLFGKALVAVGGICLQLDPEMDLVTLVKPRLVKLLAERMAPGKLLKSAAMSGWHLLNFLKGFPSQLRDVSRRMARGKWQINIRHQNLDFLANEIDRASNRLSFAVITAAIIIGSSWVLASSSATAVLGVPTWSLGVVGYVLAGLMGLWLVIAIVRSGKLS
ncbi:MAG TPA: AarF/ABC1/UbiB kinase family protein [Phycisphaerae bacterium]|nr:AarF/ABC1/UbiB kinase family protein [Phycisphaerae bacterium]